MRGERAARRARHAPAGSRQQAQMLYSYRRRRFLLIIPSLSISP
jgi:hypothetical protein